MTVLTVSMASLSATTWSARLRRRRTSCGSGDDVLLLLIPGTSSIAHLHENLAAAELALTDTTIAELSAIDGEGPQRAP